MKKKEVMLKRAIAHASLNKGNHQPTHQVSEIKQSHRVCKCVKMLGISDVVVTDSTGQSTGQKAKCDFGTRTFLPL